MLVSRGALVDGRSFQFFYDEKPVATDIDQHIFTNVRIAFR